MAELTLLGFLVFIVLAVFAVIVAYAVDEERGPYLFYGLTGDDLQAMAVLALVALIVFAIIMWLP